MAAVLALPLGCSSFAWQNLTSPLGPEAIADRDNVRVTVFNRTSYRAIFTMGFYNNWNQDSQPVINQFANGDDGSLVLEGGDRLGPITFACNRALGIGSDSLLELIRDLDPDELNEPAMSPGVGFSSAAVDEPLGVFPTEGSATGVDIYQGAEFPCDSDLLITFEEDPVGSGNFVIAFAVITPP